MARALPTIKQLRYLVTLVDEGHFGRAAEACFVTQSTLSAGIAELENLLGLTLFERTKRQVMPTPEGEELAVRARRVLREVEDMAIYAEQGRAPLSGLVRLGAIPTIGPYLLPPMIPAVRRSYPDVRLYLREEQTSHLLDRLESGRLDAAIIALPYDADGYEALEIMRDRLWVAMPEGHRLATAERLTARDLDGEDMLLLEEGHCLRDHALSVCTRAQRRDEDFQATSLFTLIEMVSEGFGITLVPELAVDSDIMRTTGVALKPLDDAGAFRRIAMVWRRTAARGGEYRLLAHVLKNLANERSEEVKN